MRLRLLLLLLALRVSAAPPATDDLEFQLTDPSLLILPPLVAPAPSLIEATIEPTKHELRFDTVLAAERWEQAFQVAARLPVTDAFSLRQELRTGMQNETILGDELTTAYHDALTVLEKSVLELKTSEQLSIAASIQQQRIANNSIPFAEIVTYGTETKFKPVKTTTLTLQADWSQRTEFATSQSDQENYRLTLEQELVPKTFTAATAAGYSHFDDTTPFTPSLPDAPSVAPTAPPPESFTRKWEGSLKWNPAAATTLTVATERSTRETALLEEDAAAYALKLQQQLFTRSKVELQAGYELHTRAPLDSTSTVLPGTTTAWTLGAASDFTLREDWTTGLGLRYRQPEDPTAPTPPTGELSLSLSIKGRF